MHQPKDPTKSGCCLDRRGLAPPDSCAAAATAESTRTYGSVPAATRSALPHWLAATLSSPLSILSRTSLLPSLPFLHTSFRPLHVCSSFFQAYYIDTSMAIHVAWRHAIPPLYKPFTLTPARVFYYMEALHAPNRLPPLRHLQTHRFQAPPTLDRQGAPFTQLAVRCKARQRCLTGAPPGGQAGAFGPMDYNRSVGAHRGGRRVARNLAESMRGRRMA